MPYSIIRRELTNSGRAIVVNDNPAGSAAKMLQELGFTVDTLDNAAASLKFAGEQKVDLLLVPHVLPGKIGTNLLVSLARQANPHTAVIITVPRHGPAPILDFGLTLKSPFTLSGLFLAVAVGLKTEREYQKAALVQSAPRILRHATH